MWTIIYNKQAEQETIGTIVASFDGQAIYKDSLDIEDTKSIDNFIECAKKTLGTVDIEADKVSIILSEIETKLNSK